MICSYDFNLGLIAAFAIFGSVLKFSVIVMRSWLDLLRPVQGGEFLAADAIGFACSGLAVPHRHPGAQRGNTREAAIGPNRPSTFAGELPLSIWPWHFLDRTGCPAGFSNPHMPKNFRFRPLWEIARGVNPGGWPVTRHIRSSDPRILTRKCCDRLRSLGAYWAVSQRALCSPSESSRSGSTRRKKFGK